MRIYVLIMAKIIYWVKEQVWRSYNIWVHELIPRDIRIDRLGISFIRIESRKERKKGGGDKRGRKEGWEREEGMEKGRKMD